MAKFIFVIFTLILSASECFSKKYYNYTLYRGIPTKEEHLRFFGNLSKLYDANYWRDPGLAYRPTEFVIPPEKKIAFTQHATREGVYYITIMKDIQSAFDLQTVKSYIRRNMDSFDWRSYFRLDDIYNWLRDLSRMYPDRMHIRTIGKTVQKRDILAVEVRLPVSRSKPKIIVEGGIHAREWISIAFATYFLNEIVTSPESNDTLLRSAAAMYDWYFVPVLNPDGYEYTHVKDRMYRKNMNGVDVNRNFGIEFGGIGTSFDKGSEIYHGEYPFSEPESAAMGDFVRSKSDKLQFYFAFHSYGQYMIIPYAFTTEHMENFDEVIFSQRNMGLTAATQIEKRYQTMYTVGTAYDTVGYRVSGVSGCWVKKTFSVPYVLTFELRDDGRHGFALPPKQILPTCKETMDGILSLITTQEKSVRELHGLATMDRIIDRFVIVWNVFLFIIVRF